MKSFFSCFSCGDKDDVQINPLPVKVSELKPNQNFEVSKVSLVQDFDDSKSRSATTMTFRTTDTYYTNKEDQNTYIRKKIDQIRKKDLPQRKAMESEFIKQNLTKTAIVYLVEKDWSQEYTAFLKDINQKEIRSIDNSKLFNYKNELRTDIKEKDNYFIINERIWKFVQQMYGGGPAIPKDAYFPTCSLPTKKMEMPIKGFKNPLFSCYMISVMQCLMSIQQFAFYFFKKQYEDSKKKMPCHNLIHKLVRQMIDGKDTKLELKEMTAFFEQQFTGSEQHDAHEFFLSLVDNLQQQTKPQMSIKSSIQCNDSQSHYTIYWKNNRSIADKVFAGQISTNVTCTRCQFVSQNFQGFLDLNIQISDVSIDVCLRKHFANEKLDDLYDCEKCKKKTKAYKQYAITKTPNFLVIVLKKFNLNCKKIEDRVKYPYELDIKKYSKGHCGQTKFTLQSALVHKGTKSTKGHYYCYTRRDKKIWYYANDELIKEIEANQALGRDAYMLIYEKGR